MNINGKWSEVGEPQNWKDLRLSFKGKWPAIPEGITKNESPVSGEISAVDLIDASIYGNLTVYFPRIGCDLSLNFSDAEHVNYTFSAKLTKSLRAVRKPIEVSGILKRDNVEFGNIKLTINWRSIWDAMPNILPSLSR